MRNYFLTGAAIAAQVIGTSAVSTDSTGVNSYCNAVSGIELTNFGQSSSYQDVIDLSGGCNQKAVPYSGGISPHDEQTSLHFRGPLRLKQFAAYLPGAGKKVKREEPLRHGHHGHKYFHKREAELREELQKREAAAEADAGVDQMVTAIINGVAQTMECTWCSSTPPAQVNAVELPDTATSASSTTSAPPVSSSAPPSTGSSNAAWNQVAYYSAEAQTMNGLVFLADNQWSTATLGYINSDASGASKTPTALADIQIPNNVQFMIFSDKKCSGPNQDCGFYNGDIAYHGFDGPKKVFLFEFSMPHDNTASAQNTDMPSIWALNAKIPRLGQYSACSCWATGCGEIDLFEVLAPGSDKCVQAVHAVKNENKNSGTPCDYFPRPADKTIKAATIFDVDSGSVTTVILPDSQTFDSGFTAAQVQAFIDNAGQVSKFSMLS